MIKKNKFYTDFSNAELKVGIKSMENELRAGNAPNWLCFLFDKAWDSFKRGEFSYDGATFVPERYKSTLFEVAAFIHDWLNSMGIVSYKADALMFKIMRILSYQRKHFVYRWVWTRLTFINIIRHRIKGTYKGQFAIELL